MTIADIWPTLLAHAGLVSFTLIAIVLFGYLLYRIVHPEGE
ncbi:MAG TPA: hypothetical protein VN864_03735 [Thermoplasmata archaeon]|nr:hypothetical protein [Thermoplasmata archaeon]